MSAKTRAPLGSAPPENTPTNEPPKADFGSNEAMKGAITPEGGQAEAVTDGPAHHTPPEWSLHQNDIADAHWRKRHPESVQLEEEYKDVFEHTAAQDAEQEALVAQINKLFDPLNKNILAKVDGMSEDDWYAQESQIKADEENQGKQKAEGQKSTESTPFAANHSLGGYLFKPNMQDKTTDYEGQVNATGHRTGSADFGYDPNKPNATTAFDALSGFKRSDTETEAAAWSRESKIPTDDLQVIDYSILEDANEKPLYVAVFGFPVKSPAIPRDQLWIDETEPNVTPIAGKTKAPTEGGGRKVPGVLGGPKQEAQEETQDYKTKTTWYAVSPRGESKVANDAAWLAERRAKLAKMREFYAARAAVIEKYTPYLKAKPAGDAGNAANPAPGGSEGQPSANPQGGGRKVPPVL